MITLLEVILLKKNNFSRIPVIVGGIIPPSDERKLKSFGVKEVFTPKDFKIEEIMKQITQIIREAHQWVKKNFRFSNSYTKTDQRLWSFRVSSDKV